MTLPSFRVDVQISTHQEEAEQYLVLHDPFGIAEGPIMLHADMIDILSVCDGQTTLQELAESAGVEADGPEIMRIGVFVSQLEELGYFEGARSEERRSAVISEWSKLATRPPVCAGSTYPEDPKELAEYLDAMGGQPISNETVVAPTMALVPHIDFRVAPHVYAAAYEHLRASDAELVVLIGTSHYWDGDPVVVTNKPFETPLGIVPVIEHPFYEPLADLAHKPEHSLELHAVLLQHLWQGRSFEILPILVTQSIFADGQLDRIASELREFVRSTGRKVLWLISGDLAHVGRKFGDELPAQMYADDVRQADQQLINALEDNDLAQYHAQIELHSNRYRICGHAPTVLAHSIQTVGKGRTIAYDVWNELETQSAVSFATIIWD